MLYSVTQLQLKEQSYHEKNTETHGSISDFLPFGHQFNIQNLWFGCSWRTQ